MKNLCLSDIKGKDYIWTLFTRTFFVLKQKPVLKLFYSLSILFGQISKIEDCHFCFFNCDFSLQSSITFTEFMVPYISPPSIFLRWGNSCHKLLINS